MKDNFEIILDHLLKVEGGYVNHPLDPGGHTIYGITKRRWDKYIGRVTTLEEFKSLTVNDVENFYQDEEWTFLNCKLLPVGVDNFVFDFGVNSGWYRSAKYLQRIVGSEMDGRIGPNTIADTEAYIFENGHEDLLERLATDRFRFLKKARHKVTKALLWPTFKNGWTKRVNSVLKLSRKLTSDSKKEVMRNVSADYTTL